MHTTLKKAELLKHSKLDKNVSTCFGLHRNHLQGAKVRLSPILYFFYPICFLLVWIFIHILHTYPLLQSQYAAIALTMPCTSFTQTLLTKRVIFSQALTLALWRWFLCKPKHVRAFLSNLECFNNSAFFNVLCVSW